MANIRYGCMGCCNWGFFMTERVLLRRGHWTRCLLEQLVNRERAKVGIKGSHLSDFQYGVTQEYMTLLTSVTINCQVTKIVMNSGWLNCQNCNQCLKCHKSPGLSFLLSKWQKQLSELWKLLSIVKIVRNCWVFQELSEIVKNWKIKKCQNVGQVMFPYYSDQMSQRSQVSRVTL